MTRVCRQLGIILIVLVSLVLPAWAGMISTSQEIKIGQEGASKLEKKYGTVNDSALVNRIDSLGQQLAANGTRGLTYRFRILRSKDINALAFPGGFIYVTEGITKVMDDRELAFVMGHEIAHVECRHSVHQIERSAYSQLGGTVLMSLLGGRKKVAKGTRLLLSATNTVIGNRYSQSDEREADHMGMELMAKAGCDPLGAIDALEVLKKYDGHGVSGFMNSFLGTHPMTSERIEAAKKWAVEIPFDRD